MTRRSPVLIASAVLVALFAHAHCSPANAQGTFGRLVIAISDQDGNPIEGVTVTATCEELPSFLEQAVTGRRGKVTLAFADGTKIYQIKLEYPGTQPLEMPFKPEIRQTLTQEITIDLSGGSPQVTADEGDGTVERSFTPTERTFNEGVELLQAEQYEAARDKFREVADKRPDMALAHAALGGVLVELGDHEGAIVAANRVLELEPENPKAFLILYEAHRRSGNEEEAATALEGLAALDTGGDASRLIYNEGVEALNSGDRRTAQERFRQALTLDPELAAAMKALAIISMNTGEFEEAAEMAEKVLAIDPSDTQAMSIGFDAYKALGREEDERQMFERILAAGSDDIGRLLYDSGVELFNSGNLDGALKNFRQALEADPSLARAHFHLGLCLVNKGNNAEAKEHFQKFLEMAPEDDEAATASEMLKMLG